MWAIKLMPNLNMFPSSSSTSLFFIFRRNAHRNTHTHMEQRALTWRREEEKKNNKFVLLPNAQPINKLNKRPNTHTHTRNEIEEDDVTSFHSFFPFDVLTTHSSGCVYFTHSNSYTSFVHCHGCLERGTSLDGFFMMFQISRSQLITSVLRIEHPPTTTKGWNCYVCRVADGLCSSSTDTPNEMNMSNSIFSF